MDFLKKKQQPPEMQQVLENISKVEGEIQQRIFQLGQAYYEKYKDQTSDKPDFYEQIDLITKLDQNRKSFYMNKLRLEGKMMCANCGAVIPYGSVFCNHCGKKADEKQENGAGAAQPAEKSCPVCGTKLEDGSLFCANCGNKVM